MEQIKYIFRDFWWVVARINLKKYNNNTRIAKAYDIKKYELHNIISKPMSDLRKWNISENKFWKTIWEKTCTKIYPNSKTMFSLRPDLYASLNKKIIILVNRLRTLWYKSIVLSDEFKPQWASIKKLWRYNSFDETILSCNIWISKDEDVKNGTTKVFDYILKKYKLKPQEAIFIDDRKVNCLVANKVWIKNILAKKSTQVVRDVKKILKI